MSCNCQKFTELYGKKQSCSYCFTPSDVGRDYICPSMGPAHAIETPEPSAWLKSVQKNARCFGSSPLLGKSPSCSKQSGGGSQLMYAATGNLTKDGQCCGCTGRKKEEDWFNAIKMQHGGGKKKVHNLVPPIHTIHPTRQTHPLHHSMGDLYCQQQLNMTEDADPAKCAKFNSMRQYTNVSSEPLGYYQDLTDCPIGNRAVIDDHDNHKKIPKTLLCNKDKGNMLDRKFDCSQPFWCSKCM